MRNVLPFPIPGLARPFARPIALALAVMLTVPAAAPAFANNPPPAEKPKAEVDPSAKRITGSENYVPFFGLRTSIARGYSIQGVMAVDAGLDIPNPKTRKKVESMRPRLISDMRDAVSGYATLSYTVGNKPDADILLIRLQKAVDALLGPGEARVALASIIVFAR